MSGHTKWADIKHKASGEQLDRARAELAQAMSLAELRQAREMTQVQLAQALDMKQPAISRIEHQTDVYLSTIRSYVRALGGDLEVCARFGDTVVLIDGFEQLEHAQHA